MLKVKCAVLVLGLLMVSCWAVAQTFTVINPQPDVGTAQARSVMADLDNDGFPELIQAGRNASLVWWFRTFKNTGTNFNNGVEHPSLAINGISVPTGLDAGDLNRDGFIDLFQTFSQGGPNLIWNTTPGISTLAGSPHYTGTPTKIADLEGDGDLDLLSSSDGSIVINRLKPLGHDFSRILYSNTSNALWGNLDSDTPLEMIASYGGTNSVFNFTGTGFTNAGAIGFSGALTKSVFADFDSDGDMDFIAFHTGAPMLFKNTGGVFAPTAAGLAIGNMIICGDMNNDGHTDIVISDIWDPSVSMEYVRGYINQGNGTFVALPNITSSYGSYAISLADFDGDGDLDLEAGQSVYRNTIASVNLAPSVPTTPTETVSGVSAHLAWNASTDDTTPAVSLSYNIHVRRADGTIIVPSHSLSNGKRQLFKIGNAWLNESFDLSCLKEGTYYWKVQAIDASYRGGAFSAERSFTIASAAPAVPQSLTLTTTSDRSIELDWVDQSTNETGYIIYRDGGSGFYPIDTVAANETHFTDNFYLEPGTFYAYRVTASNCAYPDEQYSEVTGATFPDVFVNDNWLNLAGVEGSMCLLGDFDNDGDLDLLASHYSVTKLYRFDGNGYVLVSSVVLPAMAAGAQWLDYNMDGFIDILFFPTSGSQIRLFQNVNGTSVSEVTNAGLPPSVKWQAGVSIGDYDLDGDEDLAVQVDAAIQIYENNGSGHFSRNPSISLAGNLRGQAFADFDLDGDLDILASKRISATSYTLQVFENLGDKTFASLEFPSLSGLSNDYNNKTGDFEWGDFDNDGYPDALLAGQTRENANTSGINNVYRNLGNKTFTLTASLPELNYTQAVQWGDFDNDGDLDIFSFGDPWETPQGTKIFRNDGTFVETNIDYLLEGFFNQGAATRGDIDQDGDLDYVVFGEDVNGGDRLYAYRNTFAEDWGIPNQKPSAPTSPASTVDPDTGEVTLTWDEATDDKTAQNGLTYNLWIKKPDGTFLLPPYSLADGTRKVTDAGNGSSNNSYALTRLGAGEYTWAVQSIDKGFSGSAFSAEGEFTVPEIEEVTGLADAKRVSVSPNPFVNELTITTRSTDMVVQVELSTIQGQKLHDMVARDGSVMDVSYLPAGMYILTVSTKDGWEVVKVIKQ